MGHLQKDVRKQLGTFVFLLLLTHRAPHSQVKMGAAPCLYWGEVRQLKGTHENCSITFAVILSISAWHGLWESWTSQVELSLHFVAPNVTTLLMTHAAIPAFYIYFPQVQMPIVRNQTTKNENQKDSLYYSSFLKAELRRAVLMPFIQKEDTAIVMLNCRLQDWSLRAWTGEAHLCS